MINSSFITKIYSAKIQNEALSPKQMLGRIYGVRITKPTVKFESSVVKYAEAKNPFQIALKRIFSYSIILTSG